MQDTMAIFISSQFHTVRNNETLNNDREIYWKCVPNHISLCVISDKVEPCLQYISMFWQHVVLKLSWVAINKCICISHTSTIMKCIHLKVNCSCRIVFCYRCSCAFCYVMHIIRVFKIFIASFINYGSTKLPLHQLMHTSVSSSSAKEVNLLQVSEHKSKIHSSTLCLTLYLFGDNATLSS